MKMKHKIAIITRTGTTVHEVVGQRAASKTNYVFRFLGIPIYRYKSFSITYPTTNSEMDKYLAAKAPVQLATNTKQSA
jgi:hypothetical protein